MVGVPTSRGCATCRKRKIKCDRLKPDCGQCLKSKIQCGRYARYPVFVIQGPSGPMKRLPLEEVIPYEPTVTHLYSPEVESVRLVNWFHDSFLQASTSQHDLRPQHHWLDFAVARLHPHPALNVALLAISFAKWSSKERHPGLKEYGRRNYQSSLVLTQNAVSHVTDVASDDILAAICAMTIYELLDSSCRDQNSWLNHILGIEKLLCLRGPESFSEVMPRTILEHIRYILMIKHLYSRTPCVFGRPIWLLLPWCGVPKIQEQQVIDQGLALTTLLEHSDCISRGWHSLITLQVMHQKCIDIFNTLAQLEAQINLRLITTEGVYPPSLPLSADNSAGLLLSITALGIQLQAAMLAEKLLIACQHTTTEINLFPNIAASTTISSGETLAETRKSLACRIIQLVKIRRKVQPGGWGRLRMIWSLQAAIQQFQDTDVEFGHCSLMLTDLLEIPTPFDVLRTLPNLRTSTCTLASHDRSQRLTTENCID